MAKHPYTWVRRASAADLAEMRAEVAGDNEIHQKENADDPNCGGWVYKLERAGYDAAYIEAIYDGDRRVDAGSFVRCGKCGGIRALYEGQIEFCTDCMEDWH